MRASKRPLILLAACLALVGVALPLVYLTASDVAGSAAQDSTRRVDVRLTPTVKRHKYGFADIAMLDNGETWGVGYNGKNPSLIFHSMDGGTSWKAEPIPTDDFAVKAVSFPDSQHGWCVGYYGLVLRTADGGKTWEKLARPTEVDLHDVTFVNERVGYIGGRIWLKDPRTKVETRGVEILRTDDGGATWQLRYKNDFSGGVQMAALSERIVLAVIDGKSVLRTEDGGATWEAVGPQGADFTDVAFASAESATLIGPWGNFYRSTDQGRNWQAVPNLPEASWYSVDFADSKRGIAVGDGRSIAFTDDGGATWRTIEIDDVEERLDLVKLRGSTGIVLGTQRAFKLTLHPEPTPR